MTGITDYIFLLIAFCIAVPIANKINNYFFHDGSFEMDSKDPKKDIWRVVLNIDLDKLPKRQYIVLKVNPDADLSNGYELEKEQYDESIKY